MEKKLPTNSPWNSMGLVEGPLEVLQVPSEAKMLRFLRQPQGGRTCGYHKAQKGG
jgi:hypothetical protein